MSLQLQQKQALVEEMAAVVARTPSIVAADYSGMTVPQMTQLRAEARAADIYLRVVKNNLFKRALQGTSYEALSDDVRGPLLVACSGEVPSGAARLLKNFRKQTDKLQVRLVALDGRMLAANDLDAVATLPTREEALAQLMAVMQAPITKLVQTLAAPQVKLARTLVAFKDSKADG